MSIPVEVDRACRKTLLQPLRSYCLYVFRRRFITTSGIPPPSSNFWVKEVSGVGCGWRIHQWKTCPLRNRYSRWDCVIAKLLVLPVCLVLFLLLVCTWCCSPKSDDVGTSGNVSGMPENCHSRWHHFYISSRHQLITTSGFRPPSSICKCRKCQTRLGWAQRKNTKTLRTEVIGISCHS